MRAATTHRRQQRRRARRHRAAAREQQRADAATERCGAFLASVPVVERRQWSRSGDWHSVSPEGRPTGELRRVSRVRVVIGADGVRRERGTATLRFADLDLARHPQARRTTRARTAAPAVRSTIASHSLRTRRLHGSGDELLEAMYGELLIPLREMAHIVEMLTTADERNALDLVREGQLAPDPLVTVRADRERFDDPDPPVQLLTLTDAVLTAAPPHPRARATHAA